jgi:hypothetical protein
MPLGSTQIVSSIDANREHTSALADTLEDEMHGNRRFVALTNTLAIAVVLAVFSGPFAGPAQAGEYKFIEIDVHTDLAGQLVIMVDPVNAKIWRNKPDKPKKIRWKTHNDSPYDEVFWELRYDPSKGGGTADYFGDVDIECGQTEIKVQPDKKPDFPKAEWPYSITVYACDDGVKAQEIATTDPRIIWND